MKLNNNYLLMLLPMLMNKSKGNKSTNELFGSDMLMKFAESKIGDNPMLSVMTAMMKNKTPQKQPPDIGKIFGKDVENMLNLLMALKKQSESENNRVAEENVKTE